MMRGEAELRPVEASEGGLQRAGAPARSAGASAGAEAAIVLPLPTDLRAARGVAEALAAEARRRGFAGARVFGHTAPARAHDGDALHTALGALSALGAATFPIVGWALLPLVFSAGLRVLGLASLADLVPRRPAWSVLVLPPAAGTRRLVATALDRVRVVPWLPRLSLAGLALALLATLLGPTSLVVTAGFLVLLTVGSVWLGRSMPGGPGPEPAAARAVLAAAAHAPSGTAVVLAAGAALDGDGVVAVLDWWGFEKSKMDIQIIGAPRAALALARVGWQVRSMSPDELSAERP